MTAANKHRSHSHSQPLSAPSVTQRIQRRKSISSRDAAVSALVDSRRSSKAAKAFPASLPANSGFSETTFDSKYGSSVTENTFLEVLPEDESNNSKARARRASEGSHLRKESKRAAELRCDKCGKGYKHNSCLTKHLWEHTPEWQITSKLLISKHQQVQLLEAASVLVAMNVDPSSSAIDSDSPSPPASTSSDLVDQDSEMSSMEATPPPQLDDVSSEFRAGHRSELDSKRYSTNSSAYSQSYQSSVFSESAPSSRAYMSHYRQWSTDNRPTTSGTSVNGGDDQERTDLAAAVGLLSCSFGTPKSGAIMLPADAPPVPPLPQQFLSYKADHLSGSTLPYQAPQSYSSYLRMRKETDVEMDNSDEDMDHHRSRSEDDDEGMFGKMEE